MTLRAFAVILVLATDTRGNMETPQKPTKTYVASALIVGVARDETSFALEFITNQGERIGVAFAPQMLPLLRGELDKVVAAHPNFGTDQLPKAH
jgi:hypothetical protein